MDFTTLIGFVGMGLILFAFIMLEFGKWKSSHISYDLFNLIGGILLSIYALVDRVYPFLVLNIVWSLVAFRDVVLDMRKKPKKHLGHIGMKKKR